MLPPMPTQPEDRLREALRVDPSASARRLASELGVSGRARRRVEHDLEEERARRARGRRKLVTATLLLGAGAGLWFAVGAREGAANRSERAPRAGRVALAPEAAAAETALYQAIDARDPARAAQARAELVSPEEPLRLAALRYLTQVSATEPLEPLLALFDDPSERVRTVAIRALGDLPGEVVEARLVQALLDPRRPHAERAMAAASLERRKPARPGALARQLLPALLDDSRPLRGAVARILRRWIGSLGGEELPTVDPGDPRKLHDAWQAAVAAVE